MRQAASPSVKLKAAGGVRDLETAIAFRGTRLRPDRCEQDGRDSRDQGSPRPIGRKNGLAHNQSP